RKADCGGGGGKSRFLSQRPCRKDQTRRKTASVRRSVLPFHCAMAVALRAAPSGRGNAPGTGGSAGLCKRACQGALGNADPSFRERPGARRRTGRNFESVTG